MSEDVTEGMARRQVYTYGGWRVSRPAGLGRFSFTETMGLLSGTIVLVVVNIVWGPLWALLVGVVLVATAAAVVLTRDRHGMNIIDRGKERMVFRRGRRKGANVLRNGVLAPVRTDGRCRLPGILGAARLSEHEDSFRRPFAVIHQADGRLSVVMSLTPVGVMLVDQETIDLNVALWGMWLADIADEVGVVDAAVTVETSPDTGDKLRREVLGRRHEEAPDMACRIIDDVVAQAGTGGARVRTWVTVSFDPARMSSVKRGRSTRAIAEIASSLPNLTQTLAESGGGAVHLLRADELVTLARVAYDPAVEQVLEDAVAAGSTVELAWDEAGPVCHDAEWDHLRHDSGVSRSWVMTRPPRGVVQSGVLRRLLDVSSMVERKRVTILYRPLDPARAPDVVERDVDMAHARVRTTDRPTERAVRDLAQARKTSAEEAEGAAVLDFGCVVTVTVSGSEQERRLADASAAVTSLAARARLLVRTAYGAQDSAFALGLPLGLSPAQQRIGGGW